MPSAQSIPHAAREIGYIAVGFSVLGFQRLQVRRREIERTVKGALGEIGGRTGLPMPCSSDRRGRQAQ
ncbi:MAG: hypothetical protein ACKO27_05060 [Ilumatobacteraceae bacterium]